MGRKHAAGHKARSTRASRGGASAGSENGDGVSAPAPASAPESLASGLGPAVTTEFEQVTGLQDLVGDRGARVEKEPTAPSAPAATPSLPPIPMLSVARMCDAMVSAFADVDREDDEALKPLVEVTQPLADYYAGSESSVAMLWLLACMGVCSYGLMKFQKYRLAHPKKPKPRPDVATAATDEESPARRMRIPREEMATPPGGQ